MEKGDCMERRQEQELERKNDEKEILYRVPLSFHICNFPDFKGFHGDKLAELMANL